MRTTNFVGCIDHPSVRFVLVKRSTVLLKQAHQQAPQPWRVAHHVAIDLDRTDDKVQRILLSVAEAKSLMFRLQQALSACGGDPDSLTGHVYLEEQHRV